MALAAASAGEFFPGEYEAPTCVWGGRGECHSEAGSKQPASMFI